MKINILDSSIYNRISAGEVVENPASIVKELVENSIDAGASNISIYVCDGGIKSIEIIDDGCGIEKEELPNALKPHATSKIQFAEDLDTISTLGFRGEALASISAVSEIEIKSKALGAENGAILSFKNGKMAVNDYACTQGTSIAVRNLFYNTPARFKFLSSKSTEEAHITKLVFQLILANPLVAISYYADNKLIYSSAGTGPDSAINAVFLPEIAKKFIKFENVDTSIKISGYTSPSDVFKSNRNQQIVILNGRIIFDATLQATIQNAYGDRLMHRCFPIYVLNIVMPFDEVDVNVHPNKKEVRFARPRAVYGAVYRAIKNALEEYEIAQRMSIFEEEKALPNENFNPAENQEKLEKKPEILQNTTDRGDRGYKEISYLDAIKLLNSNENGKNIALSDVCASVYSPTAFNSKTYEHEIDVKKPSISQENSEKPSIFTSGDLIESIKSDNQFTEVEKLVNYEIIGQVFDTYLIIQTGNKVLFLDQHACHERLLFDNLVKELNSNQIAVQPFLIPYIFEGTPNEISVLNDNIEELAKSGFEVEKFGTNTLKITSIPLLLADKLDITPFFARLADDLTKAKSISLAEYGKDKLATLACKSAMKGGEKLSDVQIAQIMEYFTAGSCPLQCPHGRPTYVVYSKIEFEKLFRRRV